jgi:hypothetical protein
MSVCAVCGSSLRLRRLVDPPDLAGMVSAEMECSNDDCRALHDRQGRFVREHPVTKLRRPGS